MMTQFHLCYGELSNEIQKYLREQVFNTWMINKTNGYQKKLKSGEAKQMQETIKEMFNLNNAGIDLDIYPYMEYRA